MTADGATVVAPWCTFCQELAPEFELAANRLDAEGIPLARVNCVEEKELCEQYRIPIYPTILAFHRKESLVYNGPRKADAIRSFMKRLRHPTITTLTSLQDVSQFSTEDSVTIVGYIATDDELSKATFSTIAKMYRDVYLFGYISLEAFGRSMKLEKPSIVLYKTFAERVSPYTEAFSLDKIEDFFEEAARPFVSEIGVDLELSDAAVGAPVPHRTFDT